MGGRVQSFCYLYDLMDAVNSMSGFVALYHNKLSINTTMSKATP